MTSDEAEKYAINFLDRGYKLGNIPRRRAIRYMRNFIYGKNIEKDGVENVVHAVMLIMYEEAHHFDNNIEE